MATVNLTRQGGLNKKRSVSEFTAVIDLADLTEIDTSTSGDSYEMLVLPNNAYITKADALVLEANDAATSAVFDLGFDGGAELVNDADLTSAANTLLNGGVSTVVPQLAETGGTITYTPTYVGTPTVGKILLNVQYVEIDKTNGELTVFSDSP